MSHDPDTGGGLAVGVLCVVLLAMSLAVATCDRVREGGPVVEALR